MVVFSEVLKKLKAADEYPYFIRHINGDTHDNRAENLAWVTLKNAFKNMSTWKVDWVIYLNERLFLPFFLTLGAAGGEPDVSSSWLVVRVSRVPLPESLSIGYECSDISPCVLQTSVAWICIEPFINYILQSAESDNLPNR